MQKVLMSLSMVLLVSACSTEAVRPANTLSQSGSVVSITTADSTSWQSRRKLVLTPPEVELPVADSITPRPK